MQTYWPSATACASCALYATSSCFVASALPAGEINDVRRLHNVEQDKELIRPAATSSLMGIVVEGVLRSTHMTTDGRQEVVSLHEAGSVFGHPFAEHAPYGLETATPVTLCCFDRQEFERLVGGNASLARGYMLNALRELTRVRDHALAMASPRAFERIARFILARCDGTPSAPATARLPVSRRDMANCLGTTPETISRFIQAMVRGGVLRVRNTRTLLVLDPSRLETVAGQWPKHAAARRHSGSSINTKNRLDIDGNQCASRTNKIDIVCRSDHYSRDATPKTPALHGLSV